MYNRIMTSRKNIILIIAVLVILGSLYWIYTEKIRTVKIPGKFPLSGLEVAMGELQVGIARRDDLALFGDPERAGDVYGTLNNKFGRWAADVTRKCNEMTHTGAAEGEDLRERLRRRRLGHGTLAGRKPGQRAQYFSAK